MNAIRSSSSGKDAANSCRPLLRLLLLVWLVLLSPLLAQQSGDFTYSSNGSAITITGYTGSGGAVTIPATLADLPVVAIGNSAFYNKIAITSLTILSGVTSIGDDAFSSCTGLTSVTIPSGVRNIGSYAFYYCTGLTSVTIPSSVTSIGGGVFYRCTGLTSVTIPSGVTSIGNNAFYRCTGLASVTIPSSVTSIGNNAFYYCTGLMSVTIPSGVTSIGSYAFYYCTGLMSVTIPSGMTSIGSYAFYSCTGLTSVTIPSSVTSVGELAFGDCSSLTQISVEAANTAFSSSGGVLFDHSQTSLLQYPDGLSGGYAIPSSVTSIGSYAFYRCTGLTGVTIPSSVTSIGSYAFSSCTGLTSVTIPSSATSIGSYAFYACTGLTSVTIPASVTSVGSGAFNSCTGLTSVSISSGVTSIGSYAFNSCTGLTSVTIPSSVTSIGSGAFNSCAGLTSVTISSGVTSIGSYAFYRCTGLTSVTIPASVTSVGALAFGDCSSLTQISVEAANTAFSSSGGVLFDHSQTSLLQYPNGLSGGYSIPSSVTSIGNYAFYACTGLTSVTIPASVTSVGSYAFYYCTGLTSVTISSGVTSIGSYAFYACTGLTSMTIPSSVTSVGSSAFNSCTGLTSVTISSGVTSIGSYAFYACTGLTSMTIPSSVTSIGEAAFAYCSLTSVVFGGNAPTVVSGGSVWWYWWTPSFYGNASGFTIYFYTGATGFTTPTWNGYPAVEIAAPGAPVLTAEQPAGSALMDGGTLAFGQVDRAAPKTLTVTLRNIGNSELSGLAITRDGTSAFSHTNPPVTTLAAGSSTTFTVTFSPRVAAGVSAGLHIASNDPAGPFDLTLTGSSNANVSPVYYSPTDLPWQNNSLTASSLTFTGLTLHFAPAPGTVLTLFNNLGGSPISGNLIGLPDGGAVTTVYNGTTYRFIADYTGGDGNDLVLISANPEIVVEIPAGTPFADGGTLAFGAVNRGSPKTFPVTVRNTGDFPLTGLAVTIDGTHAAHFSHTALPVTELAPGASAVFQVSFAPRFSALQSAALHIASNDLDEPSFDLTLTGNGTTTVAPVFMTPSDSPWQHTTLTASALTFDSLTIHFVPTPGMVLLLFNNTGMNAISGNLVGLSDGGTVNTVYNGVTYSFVADYTGGDGNDLVLVASGIPPEITVEAPTGTAVADGGNLAFGAVNRGSPRTLPITVRNDGSATLEGLAMTLDGTHAAHFTSTTLPATSLAPGATMTFEVSFAPRFSAPQSAVLHIASNDPDEPSFDLTLTGNGTTTVAPVFKTPGDSPWQHTTLTATALTFDSLTIHFVPTPGMVLLLFNNTGMNAISGNLVGLPDGGTVNTVYNGVTYTFVADYTGGDGNDLVLTATGAAPPPSPTLSVANVAGNEDGGATVSVVVASNAGSAIATDVAVSGIPASWSVIPHTGSYDTNTGVWSHTLPIGVSVQTATFTLYPPTDSDADLDDLVATATNLDPGTGLSSSALVNFDVVTDAVADPPVLSATLATDPVDGMYPMGISAAVADSDGSEVISKIVVSGVPTGAALSAGTVTAPGIYELSPAQLAGLKFLPPTGSGSGSWPLTISAHAMEVNKSGAEVDLTNDTAVASVQVTASHMGPRFVVEQPVGTSLGSRSLISFGVVDLCREEVREFTLRNDSPFALSGLSLSLGGADAAHFGIVSAPPGNIASGQVATFSVRFTPLGMHSRVAELTIESDQTSDEPFVLTLNGTGSGRVSPVFDTSITIGVVVPDFEASGFVWDSVTLGFAPFPGTVLTVVNNTGTSSISGAISNLADGATVTAVHSGVTYSFAADYTGGDGNDLVLVYQAPDNSSDFTYTSNGSAITITGYTGPGGAVIIPATIAGLPVTGIGNSAFIGNTSITSMTIPEGVTSIGGSAFYGCTALTSVTLPSTVTSIGSSAFSLCTVLTSVAIPSSVTTIEDNTFSGCTGLANVTIPSSVTTIGYAAFSNCYGLANMTIPSGVTTLGDSAFINCSGLTSVSIPESVTSIGSNTFYGCSSLTSVTIPSNVTSIGIQAFGSCTSLDAAVFEGDAPASFGDYVFYAPGPGFTVYFHAGATGFTTPTWNGYPSQVIGGTSVVVDFGAFVIPPVIGEDPYTKVFSGVTFTSDMPGGLGHATINGSPALTVDGEAVVDISPGVLVFNLNGFYFSGGAGTTRLLVVDTDGIIHVSEPLPQGNLGEAELTAIFGGFQRWRDITLANIYSGPGGAGFAIDNLALSWGEAQPPATSPSIATQVLSNGDLEITFTGVLQSSPDLSATSWQDVTPPPTSPFVIPKASLGTRGFFRSRTP